MAGKRGIAFFVPLLVLMGFGGPPARAAGSLHEHHLAYYSVAAGWHSELSLNNADPRPLTVGVTLFNRKGKALALPDVELPATTSVELSLNDLVPRGRGFAEGSVELRFQSANPMALGSQLTVADPERHLALDMEPLMRLRSSRLEGLWWSLDSSTDARFFLTNTTGEPLSVRPQVQWQGRLSDLSPVELGPHQLTVLDVRTLLGTLGLPARAIAQGGLSLQHDGAPGALIAHGALLDRQGRFSANLPLVDPDAAPTSNLDGNGLLLGGPAAGKAFPAAARFTPTLVVKNAADTRQTVRWSLRFKEGGEPREERGPAIELAPHEVRRIELAPAHSGPVEDAGLALEHSGRPGTLVAALSSVDRARGLVVDVPFASVAPGSGFGGSHPFRIDERWRSVAYLTNTTANPTTASYLVFYEDGYWSPDLLRLAPGETVSIDLERLRDEGVPDRQGRRLPRDLHRGQLAWTPREPNALVGRVVRFDKTTGRAANFSCPNCCGSEADHYDFFVTPFSGWPGSSQSMTVQRWDRWCSYVTEGPYDVTYGLDYSSANPSIATANPGQVGYVSPGATNITVSETLWRQDYISAEDCGSFPYISSGDTPADTLPSVRVSGPLTVPLGDKNTVQLTAVGTPSGGTYSWTTSSNKVSLSNTSSDQVTVTAQTMSAAKGDVRVTVTYQTAQGSASAFLDLTVQKPSSLTRMNNSSTTSEASCTPPGGTSGSGCGVTRTFTYIIYDQLGDPFQANAVTFWDKITNVSGQNGCNITTYKTTCPNNTGPCAKTTNGLIDETLGICSTACKSGSSCITGCTTTAKQIWTVNGIALPEITLTYRCNQILVNGQ
ncbi:MAG TPA: hypothetical protein VHC97_04375 [Thermoanaerobaculia bacterium]|nr:hypothetical protein [Thermoanaerobaculia bacterium]